MWLRFIRQEDLNIISEVYVGLGILIFAVMFVNQNTWMKKVNYHQGKH